MVLEVLAQTIPVPRIGGRIGSFISTSRLVGVDVLQRITRVVTLCRFRQLGQRILRLFIDRGNIFTHTASYWLVIMFVSVKLVSIATIAYLCVCAYSTVLKIRVLNLYYLAPNHQTDEYSLIFSGMLLCRLTPPMCLNFLGLIHMDSHIIKARMMETYYTQVGFQLFYFQTYLRQLMFRLT